MKDLRRYIRKATRDAIVTAMTSAGYTSPLVVNEPPVNQAPPFVVLSGSTLVERSNSTHDGGTNTQTFVCWGASETAAMELGDTVLQALTDKSQTFTLDDGTAAHWWLEFSGDALVDEVDGTRAYGIPYRMRYLTHD